MATLPVTFEVSFLNLTHLHRHSEHLLKYSELMEKHLMKLLQSFFLSYMNQSQKVVLDHEL